MEKQVAIDILEDIKQCIIEDNSGEKELKTIDIYRKNLEISINPTIKNLIDKQKEIIAKYGEDDNRTIKINKQISNEMSKIFNS